MSWRNWLEFWAKVWVKLCSNEFFELSFRTIFYGFLLLLMRTSGLCDYRLSLPSIADCFVIERPRISFGDAMVRIGDEFSCTACWYFGSFRR